MAEGVGGGLGGGGWPRGWPGRWPRGWMNINLGGGHNFQRGGLQNLWGWQGWPRGWRRPPPRPPLPPQRRQLLFT